MKNLRRMWDGGEEDKMGKKSVIVSVMEELPTALIQLLSTALDIWNDK